MFKIKEIVRKDYLLPKLPTQLEKKYINQQISLLKSKGQNVAF